MILVDQNKEPIAYGSIIIDVDCEPGYSFFTDRSGVLFELGNRGLHISEWSIHFFQDAEYITVLDFKNQIVTGYEFVEGLL